MRFPFITRGHHEEVVSRLDEQVKLERHLSAHAIEELKAHFEMILDMKDAEIERLSQQAQELTDIIVGVKRENGKTEPAPSLPRNIRDRIAAEPTRTNGYQAATPYGVNNTVADTQPPEEESKRDYTKLRRPGAYARSITRQKLRKENEGRVRDGEAAIRSLQSAEMEAREAVAMGHTVPKPIQEHAS